MARIIREERRQRGVFGWIALILFWGYNALMVWWLVAAARAMSEVSVPGDKYSQAGAAIGTTIGVGVILFFWVGGAVIFGLMALLTRGKTIIVERAPAGVVASDAIDTSRWSEKDRLAYEAGRRVREPEIMSPPRRLAARSEAPEPPRDYRNLDAPVTALLVLAQAGTRGLDQQAIDAILSYLEVENGAAEYSRREAAQIVEWMQGLDADESTIKEAVRTLPVNIGSVPAFIAAMSEITNPSPSTDRQARWLSALRRQVGVAA